MLVQTFYGLATGSLGLLSDSIHMFFDCIALVVGLCAAVMSKWPPSTRFPYGYGKMDTLAGFANGIFLMYVTITSRNIRDVDLFHRLISIEIIYEAMERLAEGSHINKLGELLTVSTLGLVVNLVGLLAFGHAHHGHSHGGHSHGEHSHADHDHSSHSHASHQQENEHLHHDHSHHDHSHPHHSHHDHCHHDHSGADSPRKHGHLPPSAHAHLDHLHDDSAELTPNSSIFLSVPATPSKPHHPDSHAHGHGSHGHGHGHHDHGHENMQGIFLHVLADTLGSAAVILSTILIYFFGWSGFDPLASCLIAILIFASAIPLVASSARTLLLTVPADTEYDLREALAGLSGLRGVVSYAVPKFWLEEGDGRKVLGVIHVLAGKAADMEDVRERCVAFLKGRNMDILVQVEREGDGRCWCKAQK